MGRLATATGYDAFISYSHALDGKLAPTLQTMVERFAKPWYRPRALRVFRDTASLSANPRLWASIEAALTASSWIVLLASPDAARSPWVEREIAWWLAHKSPDRLLVVLTGGEFAVADDAAPADAALPAVLRDVVAEEPRWVDLRWLHDTSQVADSNPRLRECVADVAAAVRGVPKDLLVGEHIRQHRRALRLVRGAVAVLVALTLVAFGFARFALDQRDVAQAQRDNALYNQILTRADQLRTSDVSLAAQLDALAYRKNPEPDAYSALVARGNQARATPLRGHTRKIRAVAYDPRGAWLASGAEDGTLRIWNPADGSAAVVELGADRIVNSLAAAPDGRLLVGALIDGTVQIWDVADPRAPRPLGAALPTDAPHAVAVAVSPDGRTLAAGGDDDRLHLWDLTDPASPRRSDTVLPGYRGLAWRADGRVLAAGDSADDSVTLWDTADPMHPAPLGTAAIGKADTVVNTVAFSRDGHTMVSGGTDTYAQLWDVADPARPTIVGSFAAAGNSVTSVAFGGRGATLAIGSVDQRIQLVDLANPREPQYLDGDGTLGAPNGFVMALAFDPGSGRLVSGYSDGMLRVWDVPDHYAGSTDQLQAVAFSPDGRLVAAAGHDTRIRVWRRDDPATPTVLSGHTGTVWRLAFSPDRRTLASASDDGTVRLWDLDDPAAPPRTVVTDPSPMKDVAFSPDGHTLATAGDAIRLWDLGDPGAPPRTMNPGPEPALAVTFGPDGRTLAAGYANAALDVWDLTRPDTPPKILNWHTAAVVDLAVSPDGRFLASASADQQIRLWDLTDPRRDPTVLAPHDNVLLGHTNTVNDVAFSPDGHRLASGSDDRTVRLWNLDDPVAPTALGPPLPLGPASDVGATSIVTAVAYAPDGRSLAIAGADHVVRVWDLDPDTLVARICATAAHNLTEASWQQYFRDQPYQAPPCR